MYLMSDLNAIGQNKCTSLKMDTTTAVNFRDAHSHVNVGSIKSRFYVASPFHLQFPDQYAFKKKEQSILKFNK